MRIHRWLDFKVTMRCNNHDLKCRYCGVKTSPPRSEEILSLADIHRTLIDARELGFDIFWLLGGEPSLRDDIEFLVDPISNEKPVFITVVTNGKAKNPKMYESVFSTKAERAFIQVSFDSFYSDNMKRQEPAQILALVSDLSEMARGYARPDHNCGVEVHTVITRQNRGEFPDLIRFFKGKGIDTSLAMVCPWDVVDNPVRFNQFTREEALEIAEQIENLVSRSETMPFNLLVAKFIKKIGYGDSIHGASGCGAGLTHIVVNADGEVHRCMANSFEDGKSLGNIRRERLHYILGKVDITPHCSESTKCFDAFAWDRIAIG